MNISTRNMALGGLLASALLLFVTSANAACADQSIIYGQTVNGSLSTTDCSTTDNTTGKYWYSDYYLFAGVAGDKITIQMSSSGFDPWLTLFFPSGNYINNDNGGGGTTARIPATSGYYTLLESGTYRLEATSNWTTSFGSYTLTLAKEASTTGILPSAPTNVTATAGDGSATVTFIPGSIGSGTLVNYWAACGVDTTHLVKVTGSNSPLTVTGLTNGTLYYCWVLTESTVGYSSNWSKVSNTVTPTATPAASVPVVEFYNTNLDNYFITADSGEAAAIDSGSAGPGWSRTGNTFTSGGSTSVCRFYGSQSPGPNSHFYTVDSAECQGLKDQQIPAGDPRKLTDKSWNFESLDFVSTPATNQTCPGGTVPVYRAYNNGFTRGVDSNHRITTNLTAIQQQVACGWKNEGVVMCAPSGTSSGGTTTCGSGGGGGGTSVEVIVPPSSNPQTVTANGVSVTIPGGLLTSSTKLTVTTPSSKVAQLPALSTDAKILRSYDISLGDLVGFGKELILEFPYNSGDSVPEGKNLWIYSLNENNNHWVAEHGEVDTARKVIVVRTDHLSAWSEQYYPNYLSVGQSYNHFNVYYNPNHTQPRTDKSNGYTMRDLANDTLDALESARAAYIAADFSPPLVNTVDVVITDLPSESSIDTHGNICLNRPALSSLTNLREDSAHELFHVIQNRYFTLKSMGAKQWWIEGTPDYAVATIAWSGTPLDGLKATYFETSLLSDDKPHAYQMPQFIRYLVNNRGADFKAMWDFVAAQEPNFVAMAFSFNPGNAFPAFRDYVEKVTGKVFSQVWEDYVDYAIFGKSGLMTAVTTSNLILSDTATGDRKTVSVQSYAAKVVNVSIAKSALTRSIKLSAFGLTSDTMVEIWLLTNGDRTTASLKNVLVSDKDSASFNLGANESLYAVVSNTGTADRSVTVNALSDAGMRACVADTAFKNGPAKEPSTILNCSKDDGLNLTYSSISTPGTGSIGTGSSGTAAWPGREYFTTAGTVGQSGCTQTIEYVSACPTTALVGICKHSFTSTRYDVSVDSDSATYYYDPEYTAATAKAACMKTAGEGMGVTTSATWYTMP